MGEKFPSSEPDEQLDIPSTVPYEQFGKDSKTAKAEETEFINNQSPFIEQPSYPNLENITDKWQDTKHKLFDRANQVIEDEEKAKKELIIDNLELDKVAYKEKEVALIEVSAALLHDDNGQTNRESFMRLNKELYGEYSENYFWNIINSTVEQVKSFEPKNELAQLYKTQILSLEMFKNPKQSHGENLLSPDLINKVSESLREQHKDILALLPEEEDLKREIESNEEIADTFNNILNGIGLSEWKAEVDDNLSAMNVSKETRTIKIPVSKKYTVDKVRKLAVHEIGTHVIRYENGLKTGYNVLADGTADYESAEEGLAMTSELAIQANPAKAAVKRAEQSSGNYLALGLALGADGHPRDAREVHAIIHRIEAMKLAKDGIITPEIAEKAKTKKYVPIRRLFRGTNMSMKGIVYMKDKAYYEGLMSNLQYFHDHKDNLDSAVKNAYLGKYNHTNPAEQQQVLQLTDREN